LPNITVLGQQQRSVRINKSIVMYGDLPIGNSQSKALSDAVPPSDRHPLELEDEARERLRTTHFTALCHKMLSIQYIFRHQLCIEK
jgi:hypothetical protein